LLIFLFFFSFGFAKHSRYTYNRFAGYPLVMLFTYIIIIIIIIADRRWRTDLAAAVREIRSRRLIYIYIYIFIFMRYYRYHFLRGATVSTLPAPPPIRHTRVTAARVLAVVGRGPRLPRPRHGYTYNMYLFYNRHTVPVGSIILYCVPDFDTASSDFRARVKVLTKKKRRNSMSYNITAYNYATVGI